MAYTSVIPVRRLDRTVDYVQNKAKTTPKSLEEAVGYAANRNKTESACFETGLGCTTTSAIHDTRSSPSETAFFKPSKVVTIRLYFCAKPICALVVAS